MSAPQPPTHPPTASETQQYQRVTHNIALAGIVLTPAIALLPPRKLDFYTFSLGGVFLLSANHLIVERTNKSILQNFSGYTGLWRSHPTERYEEVQQRLAREKLPRAQPSGQGSERAENQGTTSMDVAKRIWIGQQGQDWKQKRLQEERDAIAEGKGYGDLILDQISDVVNWKTGEQKERDEDETERKA